MSTASIRGAGTRLLCQTLRCEGFAWTGDKTRRQERGVSGRGAAVEATVGGAGVTGVRDAWPRRRSARLNMGS